MYILYIYIYIYLYDVIYKYIFLSVVGPSTAAAYRLQNSDPQDRVYNIYTFPPSDIRPNTVVRCIVVVRTGLGSEGVVRLYMFIYIYINVHAYNTCIQYIYIIYVCVYEFLISRQDGSEIKLTTCASSPSHISPYA
jgi:hypothetical protein